MQTTQISVHLKGDDGLQKLTDLANHILKEASLSIKSRILIFFSGILIKILKKAHKRNISLVFDKNQINVNQKNYHLARYFCHYYESPIEKFENIEHKINEMKVSGVFNTLPRYFQRFIENLLMVSNSINETNQIIKEQFLLVDSVIDRQNLPQEMIIPTEEELWNSRNKAYNYL